jgi:hypothetical protein
MCSDCIYYVYGQSWNIKVKEKIYIKGIRGHIQKEISLSHKKHVNRIRKRILKEFPCLIFFNSL